MRNVFFGFNLDLSQDGVGNGFSDADTDDDETSDIGKQTLFALE